MKYLFGINRKAKRMTAISKSKNAHIKDVKFVYLQSHARSWSIIINRWQCCHRVISIRWVCVNCHGLSQADLGLGGKMDKLSVPKAHWFEVVLKEAVLHNKFIWIIIFHENKVYCLFKFHLTSKILKAIPKIIKKNYFQFVIITHFCYVSYNFSLSENINI